MFSNVLFRLVPRARTDLNDVIPAHTVVVPSLEQDGVGGGGALGEHLRMKG